jgi:hypothetical protein
MGYYYMNLDNNNIFVSIASYRDSVCSTTIKSMFEMAENPQNIFVGVCEQNDFNSTEEECLPDKFEYAKNVRIIRIPSYQARGPTYARYLCSTLWYGEKYFLQIDSHTKFIKDWDTKCINMINLLKSRNISQKPVLSYYPRQIEEYQANPEFKEVPRICTAFFNDRGMLSFNGSQFRETSDTPYNTPYAAAGFMFCESTFLNELPFDPNLKNIFVGEEILHSIRFYTHGWDIFTPTEDIVFHEYTRETKPKVWSDNNFNDSHAFLKIKQLLMLDDTNETPPDYIMENIDKYGLGTVRSLQDYYDFAGIDLKNKKIYKDFCEPNNEMKKESVIENFQNTDENPSYMMYVSVMIILVFISLGIFYVYKRKV